MDIQLDTLRERLAGKRLSLSVDPAAKAWLAERGYDPAYGARPLRRLIQQAIGDKLARLVLAGEVVEGDAVQVSLADGGEELAISS